MKKLVLLAMVATVLTIFNGCQKDDEPIDQSVDAQLKEEVVKPYQLTYQVEVNDGMLVFESKMAFDVTKLEIAAANRKAVDLWEQSLGIKTPASIFNAVVFAEDSVSNYYESLPENEQEYWRAQYNYDPNYPYPCTLYSHAVDNVPAYSCTANPSYICPTSPHSAYYPSVNNAYINLTPHGVWQLSTTWFSDPFMVTNCTFSSTIDGKVFNYTW